MNKLITILLLTIPLLGMAEDYVTGCRADINLEADGAAIPLSTWTNGLVLWVDANAGVFNAGTTNFLIPDLSTNRNDATQPLAQYQPSSVYTNGAWSWRFDGADDQVKLTGVTIGTNNFLMTVDVLIPYVPVGAPYPEILANMFYATARPGSAFAIAGNSAGSNAVRVVFSTAGGGGYLSTTTLAGLSDGWHTVGAWRINGVCGYYLDGVYSGSTTNTIDYGTTPPFYAGRYERVWGGYLKNIQMRVWQ